MNCLDKDQIPANQTAGKEIFAEKVDGYSSLKFYICCMKPEADRRSKWACDCLFIAAGYFLALIIAWLLDMHIPMILGWPMAILSVIAVCVTCCMDIFRRTTFELRESKHRHLPLKVNLKTNNIVFVDTALNGIPVQIFKCKYKCKKFTQNGRTGYRITGAPSVIMEEGMRLYSQQSVALIVFSVMKVRLEYVRNTEAEDPIGDTFERLSKKNTTYITENIFGTGKT